jgi:hypothetical protein
MEPDAPLDFALFQLSPRRSRCELVVSGNGRTERIASGSVKPFVAHLRAAEEQAAAQPPPPAIRLQLDRRAAWFSKGTLERSVCCRGSYWVGWWCGEFGEKKKWWEFW